jgi:hypothetical protein
LALGVSDLAELEQWAAHFDFKAVTFSPIEESEFGHHLNVRAWRPSAQRRPAVARSGS